MADERQQFTTAITCPDGEASRAIIWEEPADDDKARGSQRRLISVHGRFHREKGRATSGDPVIVCNAWDEILPD